MTKRKALEAAEKAGWADFTSFRKKSFVEACAEHAFELGRIAGLREAARMLPLAGEILWDEKILMRECANALAKKARVK